MKKSISIALVLLFCVGFFSCKKSEVMVNDATERLSAAAMATGTTYYVDPAGSDGNAGTSTTTAWKTIAKVNAVTFSPGDQILFKSGGAWNELLAPKGSGTPEAPIVIDKYGGDARPVIHGGGTANGTAAVQLNKLSNWAINNLEVTNTVPAGQLFAVTGIKIVGGDAAATAIVNVTVNNCYVHDVNAPKNGQTNYDKSTGGIILTGIIYGAVVQNCHIANCSVEGIRTSGPRTPALRCKNIIFHNNFIEHIYGDGIVMSGVSGGSKVTNNTVYDACMNTSNDNFAGIWTIGSVNTQVAYNEVYGLTGGGSNDGMAFDADGYDADSETNGDIFEYNYSHDNNGGFFLFMNTAKNITVRYNVSANDVGTTRAKKLFLFTNTATTHKIYNNVFYIKNPTSKVFWNRPKGTFSNNIFFATSTATITALSDQTIDNTAKFYNNCFYPSDKFSSLNWGTAVRADNFYDDPSFVNPASGTGRAVAGGFDVSATSACRNAGIAISSNGGKDFNGNVLPAGGKPDVGAFQHAVVANAGSTLADAFVRNGTYANINYGASTELTVKSDATSYNRKAYLKFDFSVANTPKVNSAILKLFVSSALATPAKTISVYTTNTRSWLEGTINWNNAPMDTVFVGNIPVTAGGWYSLNVTDGINSQLTTTNRTVSLLLFNKGPFDSNGWATFSSKEAGTNKPVMELTY